MSVDDWLRSGIHPWTRSQDHRMWFSQIPGQYTSSEPWVIQPAAIMGLIEKKRVLWESVVSGSVDTD